MQGAVKAAGIPASFEPVDWNPKGLPDDPYEVIDWLLDPAKRSRSEQGELA